MLLCLNVSRFVTHIGQVALGTFNDIFRVKGFFFNNEFGPPGSPLEPTPAP